MRVMAMIKATPESERGELPSQELLEDMTAFNEELVKSGVLLAGDGLRPSSDGVRVNWQDDGITVTDGPFTETKELVAGYWIWDVRSMEEAVEWARRIPNTDGVHGQVELRPVFEPEDFGEAMTPDIKEREEDMRRRIQEGG
ncbi:MAG: YciI family protein [Actinomycetota bacterium]